MEPASERPVTSEHLKTCGCHVISERLVNKFLSTRDDTGNIFFILEYNT